jgi:hypothetical protein
VLTKEGIHTLVDVVIVDPTQIDLLPQSYTIQRFVASNVIQAKERNYRSQHPLINSSFWQLKYLVVYTNKPMC